MRAASDICSISLPRWACSTSTEASSTAPRPVPARPSRRPWPPLPRFCFRTRGPARRARREPRSEVLRRRVEMGVGSPAEVAGAVEHLLDAHLQDDIGMGADPDAGCAATSRSSGSSWLRSRPSEIGSTQTRTPSIAQQLRADLVRRFFASTAPARRRRPPGPARRRSESGDYSAAVGRPAASDLRRATRARAIRLRCLLDVPSIARSFPTVGGGDRSGSWTASRLRAGRPLVARRGETSARPKG